MEFIVKSLEELLVDGKNAGPVVIATVREGFPPEAVQAALYEWRDQFLRDKAEELQRVTLEKDAGLVEGAE